MTKPNKTLLLLFLTLISCTQTPIKNLSEAKQEVKDYYENGFYGKETYDIIDDAIKQLSDINIDNNSAVVFDVDETTLSNYKHIKEVDFGWVKPLWNKWVEDAKAENIPQVKKLYDYLIENGISVIFLTGRKSNEKEFTRKNLLYAGYTKFDTLICRSEQQKFHKAADYKILERKKLTQKGYNIIMCVGDQWSDLEGDFTGIKVKLPNLLYKIH